MLLLWIFCLFVLIFAATAIFGYHRIVKRGLILDQVANSAAVAVKEFAHVEEQPAIGLTKFLGSLGKLMPTSPKENRLTKRELVAAGLRSPHAAAALQGSRLLMASVLLLLAIFAREMMLSDPMARLALPAAAGICGYIAPGFIVGRMIARRREKIRMGLPDVLDLLVISTEAGCALDKAIVNVSREFRTFHPTISEELSMVTAEMLAGNSRMEALRNFASRTGEEELGKLVAMLIQTDRFGTSLADALRTQSEHLRTRRRQEAEERAGKVGVKLIFPIFVFFMPGLMILVIGPGLLDLFYNFLPALAGSN